MKLIFRVYNHYLCLSKGRHGFRPVSKSSSLAIYAGNMISMSYSWYNRETASWGWSHPRRASCSVISFIPTVFPNMLYIDHIAANTLVSFPNSL